MYSFLLHIFSYNIAPIQFRYYALSVSTNFHLPCSNDYIFFTLSLHMAQPCSHASPVFLLMFATPAFALISSFIIFSILFIPIIHLTILSSVLSSKSCAVFLSAQLIKHESTSKPERVSKQTNLGESMWSHQCCQSLQWRTTPQCRGLLQISHQLGKVLV